MLVAFLIMLREGIEAALIVGIVASYLARTGRREWLPAVWLGVIAAIVCCAALGVALEFGGAEFPQKQQEAFAGVVALIAVGMLTYMVFWMRKASRTIAPNLHASIDAALAGDSKDNKGGLALAMLAFLAVGREGLETIFFLLAIVQQSDGWAIPAGAALGLLCAIGVGLAIYVGGTRINLRRFFQVTSIFIVFVAAGLLASGVRAFHEAGLWNGLQGATFDFSGVLPDDSPLGALLAGMFGYQEAPTLGEVVAYVAYLAPVLLLYFAQGRTPPRGAQHALPNAR